MKRIILAFVFLILGVLGIVFPIIPGIPFLLISAFLFGIIPHSLVLKVLKKVKTENKNSKFNKLINYVLIKYVHEREPIEINAKN
ncbi:hypothetical protein [Persephonella sp. KM09-Lau-8]|uniref:hypothetical protein n=1 Tax=Persephonella sp. KM09-Lau-8 TaxID=1158345 RepID=UPI0004959214|nr:hypothetical protein [Persephonella sp. KM09-Lau-8]